MNSIATGCHELSELPLIILFNIAAESRGTPVLLSASVSDNSGNSPQMSAPRRSREIDQSTQRFHVGCDNRCGYRYKSWHPFDPG